VIKLENLRIEIFVPRIEPQPCLKSFYETLAREFGGFTAFEGFSREELFYAGKKRESKPRIVGFWINERGEIESDEIQYILIFSKRDKDETLSILDSEAKRVGKLLKQACFLYVVNNKPYFVEIK
jgi:hypothetical protein